MRRTQIPNTDQTHHRARSLAGIAMLAVASIALTACSSGTDPNLQSIPATLPSPASSARSASSTTTTSTTTPAQGAVITAWAKASQLLYAYMDEPPAPLRADLVAGETTADLFPKLADYYVQPALGSESMFLLKLKMKLLNGPTSYNLGTPKVTALTATTATVAFCGSDTGTTTASGQPGPPTLDGSLPNVGGGKGTSSLVLVSGSWKIASGQTVSVAKC